MPGKWLFEKAQTKLAAWITPFREASTIPTWQRVLVPIHHGLVRDVAFQNAVDAFATGKWLKVRTVDLIEANMGSKSGTQNDVSRTFFGLFTVVAEFERDRIKERSAEGRAPKRQGGDCMGATASFGFHKVGAGCSARLEPDPAQQATLGEVRTLSNESVVSWAIAEALLEQHGLAKFHITVRAARAQEKDASA